MARKPSDSNWARRRDSAAHAAKAHVGAVTKRKQAARSRRLLNHYVQSGTIRGREPTDSTPRPQSVTSKSLKKFSES